MHHPKRPKLMFLLCWHFVVLSGCGQSQSDGIAIDNRSAYTIAVVTTEWTELDGNKVQRVVTWLIHPRKRTVLEVDGHPFHAKEVKFSATMDGTSIDGLSINCETKKEMIISEEDMAKLVDYFQSEKKRRAQFVISPPSPPPAKVTAEPSRIEPAAPRQCEFCNGSGRCPTCLGSKLCQNCKGTKQKWYLLTGMTDCPECSASGFCSVCKGSGFCSHCLGTAKAR
jgi:hypothetical protein